jgi:serine/threonine protein kinase
MADILGLVGKKLGKYEITGYLGAGGMSFIYRARQEAFRREVAIKVTSVADAKRRHDERIYLEFAKRFSREAEVVSRLNHPHILKVFDYGEDGGYLYLVMELHTGGTLATLLQQGRLSLERASKIIQDLAEALDYAHQHGVIHRDIKPQNVLMDEQGNAILTDFGIAKVIDDTTLTNPGSAVGTPTYMSPEQWQGLPLDGRSDQYSLGVMTYEMLSGWLPFPSDTPFSLMTNHLNTPPPPLRLRCADIPEPVEYVITKALAKERTDRFASTKQFAAAFAIATKGQMPSDDPLDSLPPPRKNAPAPMITSAAPMITPIPITPMTIPLAPTNKREPDATIRLPEEAMESQQMRLVKSSNPWLTIGAAGIIVLVLVLVLLANNGQFLLVAQGQTNTPTPTHTSTPLPTDTPTPLPPTATNTPTLAPSATSAPPPIYLTEMFAKDFENDILDDIVQFTGGWEIAEDPDNKANHLLCVTTGLKQWNQFNLVGSDPWTDYSIQFRAQLVHFDESDGNAGNIQIALRAQERPADGSDPSSYYVGLDALKKNTFLQKWTKEEQVEFGYGDTPITFGRWYDIRVEIQGVKMRLYIDGKLEKEATDTSFSSGAVGIQAAPNSLVCVDDIMVRSLRKTVSTTLGAKQGTLTADQDLLNAPSGATTYGNLSAKAEVFIIEESADKKWLLVRDDKTGLQGWVLASGVDRA